MLLRTRMYWVIALLFGALLANIAHAAPPKDDINFVDLDGNSSKLSDYQGKWVIVNLWATWCPPCLVEIPDLVMFHEENKDKGAVVLGVNYESIEKHKVKEFAQSQMINFPVLRFEGRVDGKTSPFGPLYGLPTTYMVAPDGTVVAARTGMVNQEMLESFIQKYNDMKSDEGEAKTAPESAK